MSTEHTPGHLHAHHDHGWLVISDRSEDVYLKVAKGLGSSADKANARRLVACWNACEGISTEALETDGSAAVGWVRTASKLVHTTTQRDELLEALKRIEVATLSRNALMDVVVYCYTIAHAAITKAEGASDASS